MVRKIKFRVKDNSIIDFEIIRVRDKRKISVVKNNYTVNEIKTQKLTFLNN